MSRGLLIAASEHGPGLHGGLAGIAIAFVVIAVVAGVLFALRERRRSSDDAGRDRGPEA